MTPLTIALELGLTCVVLVKEFPVKIKKARLVVAKAFVNIKFIFHQ